MKIGILTMFNGISNTYSLVNVVAEHLGMLLNAGINVKLLVSEDCPDSDRKGIFLDERIEWVKVTNRFEGNQIEWHDYSQPEGELHKTFFDEAEIIANDLIEKLADVDICIMHDIHYQGWHLVHNIAVRKAQEKLTNIKFIAMVHSAPVNRPKKLKWPFLARYTSMPNTTYIYPTYAGISALARQYDIPEGKCRVVNNSLDLLGNMSSDIKNISKHIDLISPDILMIYPARLTTGKKFEKIAALGGTIFSKTEKSVKIVFCDFPSMDIEPKVYKEVVKKVGYIHGLSEDDILFTSDIGYPNGFPREGVMELFTLSNLYVCPSYSESFGLTVLEAASRGNFLVLNESVPALEELGKKLHAYFMRWDARNFGYDTKEKYNPSELVYLQEYSQRIVNAMRDNSVIYSKTLTRQMYSPEWIFKNQIEPLING